MRFLNQFLILVKKPHYLFVGNLVQVLKAKDLIFLNFVPVLSPHKKLRKKFQDEFFLGSLNPIFRHKKSVRTF
jgi:hypothetical protein